MWLYLLELRALGLDREPGEAMGGRKSGGGQAIAGPADRFIG
jgi:hypothetical protein